MVINHNMNAANALRNANINQGQAAKSMEKLSSGLRINRAGDDAAGLSISEKMRAQIRGLNQASTNAQDGISMVQTAEGALNETQNILQRMRELAVQAANGTYVEKDRDAINEEMKQLNEEIDRIADTTEFNTQNLFGKDAAKSATATPTVTPTTTVTPTPTPTTTTTTTTTTTEAAKKEVIFQVGANSNQSIKVEFSCMTSKALEVNDVKVDSHENATNAITTINNAITKVSTQRSTLGAVQNRLEHTIANLDNASENLTAAESRIRDVNMAKEMSNFSKNNILQQAAQAMLAQANQLPQNVLQLLR